MSTRSDDPTIDDPQFAALLATCLETLERGEAIDADRLQREHPEYADEILRFVNDRATLGVHGSDPSAGNASNPDGSASGMGAPWMMPTNTRVGYFGDYILLKELARGGMGIVYKARQEKLGRIVAVKMILAGRLATDLDVQRFQREARAAANLSHPHIVAVHEVGEHEGQHFFSMDYIDGESLSTTIRDHPLSPLRACEILTIVARALHYSHQQGTLHRDLKPSNILLDPQGQPHVTDFGLAKVTTLECSEDQLTTTGQVLGTPNYMSPEQAGGKHALVGPASDIYSLGVILYASLTGRPPFAADTVADTLLQVIHNEPLSPRLLSPDLPKDLETICLKCLQKRPHERYGTADELADDLDRFQQGRPVLARPVGVVSKACRWCRRNPAVASLLVLVILSLAAGTGVSALFAFKAEQRARSEALQRQQAEKSELRAAISAQNAAAAHQADRRSRRQAEEQLRKTEREVYANKIAEARLRLNACNPAGAEAILVEALQLGTFADVVGWEWNYLRRMCRLEEFTRPGQQAEFVLDSREFVVVTSDSSAIEVVETNTGKTIARLPTECHPVQQLVVNAERSLLAIASRSLMEIWNIGERRRRTAFPLEGDKTLSAAFNPRGDSVAVLSRRRNGGMPVNDIAVHSTSDGELIRRIDGIRAPQQRVLFAPGGEELLLANFWPLGSHAEDWFAVVVRHISPGAAQPLIPVSNPQKSVHAFSPDGSLLAVGFENMDESGFVMLSWPDQKLQNVSLESLHECPGQLSFCSNGKGIAGSVDNVVTIWDATSGKQLHKVLEHSRIDRFSVGPDGRWLLTTTSEGVRMWHLDRVQQGRIVFESANRAVAVSPDGGKIAANRINPTGVVLVDTQTGHVIDQIKASTNGVQSICFGDDGRTLVTCGQSWTDEALTMAEGDVQVWSLTSSGVLERARFVSGQWVTKVAIGAGGQWLAAISSGTSGTIWSSNHRSELIVIDSIHPEQVQRFAEAADHLAFASDGRRLAIAKGPTVQFLDVTTGMLAQHTLSATEVPEIEPVAIRGIEISSDNRLLALNLDRQIAVVDRETRERVSFVPANESDVVFRSMLFHPDSSRLFVGDDVGVIHVFEVTSGIEMLTLHGHSRAVVTLAMGQHGEQLISTSDDNTVRIWDGSQPDP